MSAIEAVIFDLGGVVLRSPLHEIAAYEREREIPEGFLNRVVRETGPEGAWSRLERGELDLEEFCAVFDEECSQRGHVLPAAVVMERIAANSGPRPEMLMALRRLREAGLATVALTNNWKSDGIDRHGLRPCFDHFFESSRIGFRKPDPRIYEHVFSTTGFEPQRSAFLDDIGANLKTARAMGVHTIKVVEPQQALRELATAVGLTLS